MLVGTKPEHAETFRFVQKCTGGILSPFDSYLLLRGVKTLAVRMEQHDANGRVVADFLAGKLGAAKVAGAIVGLMRKARGTLRVEAVVCNSAPAVLFYLDNRLEGVITVDVVDDKITNFYAVRNPDKLAALTTAREISRG